MAMKKINDDKKPTIYMKEATGVIIPVLASEKEKNEQIGLVLVSKEDFLAQKKPVAKKAVVKEAVIEKEEVKEEVKAKPKAPAKKKTASKSK